ncbi:ammonium transporter [Kipferlia bialata]|uniref:Ammonium transporter n=1 Tax=Kipferlia bialata TaxID=797122 RepID=A0A9K3CQ06_9EUKA|nr:ammonium transporter [Kipferlia bialata]|eukprot:g993.t1
MTESKSKMTGCGHKDSLWVLLIVQALLAVFFCFTGEIRVDALGEDTLQCVLFVLVAVMLVVGFPALMAFPGRFGFSALFFSYVLIAVTFQFHLFMQWLRELIEHHIEDSGHDFEFHVGAIQGLEALFAVAVILISFGVVEGRWSFAQYIVAAILETCFYTFSCFLSAFLAPRAIGHDYSVMDFGGSILVHLFGGVFGVCMCMGERKMNKRDQTIKKEDETTDKSGATSYTSDQISAIGSLVLWAFWPAFAAALTDTSLFGYNAVATLAALCASTIVAFPLSGLFRAKEMHLKFDAADLANASLAGGVAVGAMLGIRMPFGVIMLTGMAAGCLSVAGYAFIQPAIQAKIPYLRDACGVMNLHLMPGLLGGLLNIIVIATGISGGLQTAGTDDETDFESKQWLVQLLCLLITIAFAMVTGGLTGVAVSKIDTLEAGEMFHDHVTFETPEEGYNPCEEEEVSEINLEGSVVCDTTV